MKTITTTPRYFTSFWNMQRGRNYDASELSGVRAEAPSGYYLPNESDTRFRTEQEKMNIFRKIATVIFTQSGDKKIKAVMPIGAAAFVSETGSIPESDTNIVSYTIQAHKIAKISKRYSHGSVHGLFL